MEGFRELNNEQKQNLKAGFAWMAMAELALTAIGVVRALFSPKGSVGNKAMGTVSWDESSRVKANAEIYKNSGSLHHFSGEY